MRQHLSAGEISAWLAGERTAERDGHLRECAECRAAVERVEAPLARFRCAVQAWSSQEISLARPIELRRRHGFGMMRLAMAAAMVVMLAGVPLYLRDRARDRAAETARQDEALLEQVQTEVARSVPEPMEPLAKLVVWSSDSTK